MLIPPFGSIGFFTSTSFEKISIVSVLGSDVIYSEEAVADLVDTLLQLCGPRTTVFLAGELRNGKNPFVSSFHTCYGSQCFFLQQMLSLNTSSRLQ